MTDLRDSIIRNDMVITKIKKRLEIIDLIDPALSLIQKRNSLAEQEKTLSVFIKEIQRNDNKIQQITGHLRNLLTQMLSICPFCRQMMPEVTTI